MKIYLFLLLAVALLGDASGYTHKKRVAGVRGLMNVRQHKLPMAGDNHRLKKLLQSRAMHGAPRSSERHRHA